MDIQSWIVPLTKNYKCGALYHSEATGLQWWNGTNGEDQTRHIQLTQNTWRTERNRITMWHTLWQSLSHQPNFRTHARPNLWHRWNQMQQMQRIFHITHSIGLHLRICQVREILRLSQVCFLCYGILCLTKQIRIIHFIYFYLQNLFPSTTSDHEFTSANFRT